MVNLSWLKLFARRSGQMIVKNSPHILMALGTGCSISAAIFAAKAAPDANAAIAEKRHDKARKEREKTGESIVPLRKLTVWEWIQAVAKYYGPAAAMEILALFCFWAAHGIDIRRQAVLSSLCAAAEQALQEYQRKVKDMLGKETEREIRNGIAEDQAKALPPASNNFYMDSEANETFIYRGQRFRSSYNRLKEAENLANHQMISHMYLSELELIWLLDPDKKYLKPDTDSGQVGWNVDELMTFDIHWVPNENHRPEGVIEIVNKDGERYPPRPGYCMMA